MRVLNHSTKPRVKGSECGEPDVFELEVMGKKFAYDCNSMTVVLLDEGESVDNFSPPLGSKFVPEFPLSNIEPRMLVLEACHSCNLKCTYCFAQAYYPDSDMMSFATGKRALDYFFSSERMNEFASIGFFGGEPMLNWKLITSIVPYFEGRAFPRKAKFHITTNGTLITKEKAEFFRDHNFTYIVSIDGSQPIHDQHRKYKDGKGSFEDTIRGLKLLKEAGCMKPTLRGTYSADSHESLFERVRYLNHLVDQGLGGWVDVEPAFLTESACVDSSSALQSVDDTCIQQLEQAYTNVAEWYVREVKAGQKPILHGFYGFLKRLLYCIHSGSECGAGKGYFSVNAQKDISACHRERGTKVGGLDVGGVNPISKSLWHDNRICHRIGCMECPIRYMCGGGCREESIMENKDIRKPFKVSCSLKMILFKCCLWIMSEIDPVELSKLIQPPPKFSRGKKDLSPPPPPDII